MASGSGWNLWVWLVGVVVRRYIDSSYYLSLLLLYLFFFAAASYFLKCSSFLFQYFFVIYKMLCIKNIFLHSINTDTGDSRQPYEGCT